MSVALENNFSFPVDQVEQAVAFPSGTFVEVDDLAFEINGLGRKVVQTQLVQIGSREVSVSYLNVEGTGYELVLASDSPRDLGNFDQIIRSQSALYGALQKAFGNSVSSYSHLEMVVAINKAMAENASADDEVRIRGIATWARTHAKRATWVIRNHMDAVITAPVDWKAVGL
ncbi:hypothetical protein [Chromobacterium haemolyticum]|uniref:hypothetical protein n=1 Tax=Chromobacterium haemolyticum TaxID=394935 RepID=UPI00244D13CC|nr:hypothetical protein [Chromobacterium haemolyticum]MDH0342037.1 hypothetical protein [Chromobacterium haemolyticum]